MDNVRDTATESSLDIYARPYIPQALQQFNQISAQTLTCKPAPWIDFRAYCSSFAGRDFLPSFFAAQNISDYALQPDVDISDLTPTLYAPFFIDALRQERIAQQEECAQHDLYNISMQAAGAQDPRGSIYFLAVPGLREADLRIEIGDIVHIRILPTNAHGDIVLPPPYVQQSAPFANTSGFHAIQYDAVVWDVDRLHERLSLNTDGVMMPSFLCNARFTVQALRVYANVRAVQDVHSRLDRRINGWLRSMLLPHAVDGQMQRTLNSISFNFAPHDPKLNYEQLRAIDTVLRDEYGSVPYLVSGPPGTGKTKTVVELALQLLDQDPQCHLLLCAPSDPASDTLVERLSKYLNPVDLFRLNGPSRTFAEVPESILAFCHVDDTTFSIPPFAEMMRKKIVVTSCRDADVLLQARLANTDLFHLESKMSQALHPERASTTTTLHWTGLIIDEAAQATEPEAVIPLLVVAPPVEAEGLEQDLPIFVMVGDQKQLGPRTASKDTALNTSLFERILARPLYATHPLARSLQNNGIMRPLTQSMLPIIRPPFTNLIRNYRSHPSILSVPSSLFYNDTLEPHATNPPDLQRWPNFPNPSIRILFHSITHRDTVESLGTNSLSGGGGWLNHGEAAETISLLRSLALPTATSPRPLLHPAQIIVMSPFRVQVRLLRSLARAAGLRDVNIGPLEAYQGMEARFVILCTTRTSVRFVGEVDRVRGWGVVGEARRMNVALTRAREGLVVIGNGEVLGLDEGWREWLGFCARNGCWTGEGRERWDGSGKVGRLERGLGGGQGNSGGGDDEKAATRRLGRAVRRLGLGRDEEADMWDAGLAAEGAVEEEGDDEEEEDEDDDDHGDGEDA